MAFPSINPKQWQCTHCHWTDSHIQKSDCLTKPTQCPKCGSKEFQLKDASVFDNLLNTVVDRLFR